VPPNALRRRFQHCSSNGGGICNLYDFSVGIGAMELSERQRKYLRGLGHVLDPVLLIGQHGVTAGVIAEAQRALHDHELIKVKFRGADREVRDAGLAELATAPKASVTANRSYSSLLQTPNRPSRNCDTRRIKSRCRWPIPLLGARIAPTRSSCRSSSGKSLE
jgi:RNA-binding protein